MSVISKKICLFNYPPIANFHGYKIDTFDPLKYFHPKDHWALTDIFPWGLNGYNKKRGLTSSAAGVDKLYRERDPSYMKMVGDFVDKFQDYDLIVMSGYNFIHPEILVTKLSKPIKVLGFIDDPMSTYRSGIPFLWAFDGAFYISPSYIDNLLFSDAIKRWGNKPNTWWPLVPYSFQKPAVENDDFFINRNVEVTYVGNPSASKVDRLIKLKKHFGDRMKVHGRWPFKGYIGLIRGLFGKPVYPYKVTSLSVPDRTNLYWNTKIGFNMHVSDTPTETGNVRMYESVAHGMLMICDKAGADGHNQIFKDEVEALYYNNVDNAIDLIESLLRDDKERLRIAKNGYNKYWQDYEWESNLKKFLDWALSIQRI